ncbi:MAG: hypothetical protein HY314_02755 [Acidobacteria bacterium]|nr:hypothetical protein [Acidobacteriota bacterium]
MKHKMEQINQLAKLSQGLAVSGMKDTIQALNEGHVQRLIFCADLAPEAGWQCRGCQALYVGMEAKPEKCSYCGCTKIYMADLKAGMITRAYQLGCLIAVMSRSPELEAVGGVCALLDEAAQNCRHRACL